MTRFPRAGARWRRAGAILFALLALGLAGAAIARWPVPAIAESRSADAPTPGGSPWELEPGWPQVPGRMRVSAGSGVAVDAEGHVWLLHRAGHAFTNDTPIMDPTVLRLDPRTGAVERAWGAGLFKSPHGLSIDRHGMLWITDVMANTVSRFTPEGRELLRVGRPYGARQALCVEVRTVLQHLPCALADDQFARPTDVAVAPDGTFFVADGYRNSRIAHFDAEGRFLAAWGSIGNAGDDLYLPHGIALDGTGRLYIADRRNARVQVRDGNGNLLALWQPDGLGRPFGVTAGADGSIYVADGGDALDAPRARPRSQAVQLAPDGTVKGRWGWYGDALPPGLVAHDIAVGNDGSLYVATLDAHAIYKLRRTTHALPEPH